MMFVEALDRHGEVRFRTRIEEHAFTVGRAYDNDLILDDPYVAAHHLRIERDAQGALQAVDLGSRNGLHLLGPARRVPAARIVPNLRIRIGHTQLRFRDMQFAVEPELEARAGSRAFRHGATFYLILIFTALLLFGIAYLSTFDQTQPIQLAASVLALLLAAFVWAGTWAFFGRLATRHANFHAHGIVTLLGIAAVLLVYELSGYIEFAFSSSVVPELLPVALVAIFGGMLYRHIRLVSRSPARRAAGAAVAVALILLSTNWLVQYSASLGYSSALDYAPALKAPAFRLVAPESPETFVERAQTLREQIDRLRAED
jgi:pSer/pThr/pTyr-binding forkhead associated (FHA) protein